MSEPGKDAGLTASPDPAAPPGKKIYTCGTLKYTLFGLITLFMWLLWGDFVWVLLNSAIPGILPLKLNEMGASDTAMSLLVRVLGMGIVFLLNPIVSFWSDRYRSRWGRRIPFLLWSTPLVGLFMVLIGCYENLTQFVMGDTQRLIFMGYDLSRTTVSLIIFAILIVGFDLVDIYNDTIYYYLFNDVVPPQFLARFLSLFRIMGGVAGVLYNAFFMEHALTHFRLIWVVGGIAYTIGYLLMCFFVKEGEYPPPPENIDKRKGLVSAIKTFAKECFTHRFYWYFFLANALFMLSWCSGLFGILRNTGSLELSLKDLAWMGIYLSPIGFALMYPAGWLADKFNPIRVFVFITFITFFSNIAQSIFLFTDYRPSVNLMIMYGISVFFMPFSSLKDAAEMPMYMRLLPKDRYGQFCSANGMVKSFVMLFGSLFAGIFMQYLGTIPAENYHGATSLIEVTATKTQTSEWKEESVGPWKVDYRNNDDRAGTITVPGASAVRVYFSEIRVEHGWDRLTTDAQLADDWSGNFDKVFSGEKSGDALTLRVRSNMTKQGSFIVTKVAYQGTKAGDVARAGTLWDAPDNATFSLSGQIAESVRVEERVVWWNPATWSRAAQIGRRPVPGATVTFAATDNGPAPAPVVTDCNGSWTQNGFAKGSAYRVAVSKTQTDGTWTFTPPKEDFSDAPKDGVTIAATWTEATEGWTEEEVGPWSVRYQNNWDRTGTITVPGATAVKVYFDVFKTQAGVDHLTTDAESAVDRSGNFDRCYSEVKSGDTLSLRLTTGIYANASSNMTARKSGNLYNDYEIRVTKVKYRGTRTGEVTRDGAIWDHSRESTFPLSGQITSSGIGVAGVTVAFRTVEGDGRVPEPVTTDAYGNWCQVGFVRGSKYLCTASKIESDGTWTFTTPTIGDWRYRYYPIWTVFFQAIGIVLLLLLYREWKRLGGDKGYTPPQV